MDLRHVVGSFEAELQEQARRCLGREGQSQEAVMAMSDRRGQREEGK